ncbi:MAG: tetratricopeptide repeat protein [Phycisphaerae bacterium]
MTEPEQPENDAIPPESESQADPFADVDPTPPADGSAAPVEAPTVGSPAGESAANGAALLDDGLPPEFTAGLRSHRGMWYLIVAGNVLALAGLAAVFLVWKPWEEPSPGYAGPLPGRYPSREQPPGVTPAEPPVEDAFSLHLEEEAYAGGRYREAVAQCDRLLAATRGNPRDELLADFFRLRRAQSQKWLGEMEDARDGLLAVTESPSPIVRGLALLELAQLSLADRQYLTARTEAYRALGAFGAVVGTAALKDTCDFLTAEALTRKVLAFYGADDLLPEADLAPPDPFSSLPGERAIRSALEAGLRRFQDAATGLRAERNEPERGGIPLWSITSVGAPLEEILHRLAGSSEVAVMWASAKPAARRRAVLMAVRDVSAPRAIEVACGSAGLVARLSGAEVQVHDPRDFRSTQALQSLLTKEAESMWRRRLLDNRAASRHAWAHYALGLLHEHGGETASAMAEFNLLTRQQASSPLAPRAQLRSAGIRIGLRDYAGAREQLLDLLNRHPNFPDSDLVYLRLGQSSLKTGLYEKALTTFRKLYYWELSRPSQIGAAFGAGKGYYLLGQHREAVEWLGKYRKIAHRTEHADRAEAEYLLAKSLLALGEAERAEAALRRCLALEPPQPLRADATLALAGVLAKAEEFAEALALLHRVEAQGAPADRIDQAVLAEGRLLQDMGLAQRAMHRLKDRRPDAADTQAAVEMEIEIARCAVALDHPEDARRLLAGAAAHLDPGPLARRVSAELAEVHLALGRVQEAASLARSVLAEETHPGVRRHALQTLGKAYLARRDYDRAAIAFAGKVPDLREGDQP